MVEQVVKRVRKSPKEGVLLWNLLGPFRYNAFFSLSQQVRES